MEIRQTLVFDSRLKREANWIASGEIWVLIPFRYGLNNGSKIFLFFPNLLPDPELYTATVRHAFAGATDRLRDCAENAGKEVKIILESGDRSDLSLLFNLKAEKIPMSQTEVINKVYAEGKLPEIPE